MRSPRQRRRGGGRQDQYGWFVYAPEEPAAYSDQDLPDNLRRISEYAREHGCEYVLFDADAEIDPALPVFNGKTGEEIDPQPAPQD